MKAEAKVKHVIMNLDGGPVDDLFDDCPLCRAMLASGEPMFSMNASGELVEVHPRRN